jgi:hypothetical protein
MLFYLHKIFHYNIANNFLIINFLLRVPSRLTGQTYLFHIAHTSVNSAQRSLFLRMPTLYNGIMHCPRL